MSTLISTGPHLTPLEKSWWKSAKCGKWAKMDKLGRNGQWLLHGKDCGWDADAGGGNILQTQVSWPCKNILTICVCLSFGPQFCEQKFFHRNISIKFLPFIRLGKTLPWQCGNLQRWWQPWQWQWPHWFHLSHTFFPPNCTTLNTFFSQIFTSPPKKLSLNYHSFVPSSIQNISGPQYSQRSWVAWRDILVSPSVSSNCLF